MILDGRNICSDMVQKDGYWKYGVPKLKAYRFRFGGIDEARKCTRRNNRKR